MQSFNSDAAATFSLEAILEALNLPLPYDNAPAASRVRLVKTPASADSQQWLPYTDSRQEVQHGLFIPLSGERFDGHDFIPTAIAQGAGLVLVKELWLKDNADVLASLPEHVGILAVEEPLLAYMALGRWHRKQCNNSKVIALTGSSGKTTVKDLLILGLSHIAATQGTVKNHNNDIGLTQTLLSLKPETRFLVTEMGMRGLGEIRRLTCHAEPDLSLILNVGPAHIGRLGSLEAIAQAKCEIVEGLSEETGICVYNSDDNRIVQRLAHLKETGIWRGKSLGFSSTMAENRIALADGCHSFSYKGLTFTTISPGMHQLSNTLAVIVVFEALELSLEPLAAALMEAKKQASGTITSGRWTEITLQQHEGSTLINDAYNANPASMQASIEAFLAQQKKPQQKRLLILGSMNELGDLEAYYHKELLTWLSKQALEGLLLVGDAFAAALAELKNDFGYPVVAVNTASEVMAALQKDLALSFPLRDWLIFLKGSRGYALEQLVEHLQQAPTFSNHC